MKSSIKIILGGLPLFMITFSVLISAIVIPIGTTQYPLVLSKEGSALIKKQNQAKVFRIEGVYLIAPFKFVSDFNELSPSSTVEMPGFFKKANITPTYGYASYGFKIRGLNPEKIYALNLDKVFSASRVFVNGNLVFEAGKVGTDRKTEIPQRIRHFIPITPKEDGSATILLHVSNHNISIGGIRSIPLLGEYDSVKRIVGQKNYIHMGVSGTLITIALFFGFFYLFNRKQKYLLYYSLLTLVSGIRTLIQSPYVINDLIDFTMPWQLHFKIGYLTFALATLLITVFIRTVLDLKHPLIYKALVIISLLYSLIILLTPPYIAGLFLLPFQITSIIASIYNFVIAVIAAKQEKQSAYWIFSALLFATVSYISSIITHIAGIGSVFLVQQGHSITLFIITLMILEKYASSFRKVEEMTEELSVVNKSLIRFIPEELPTLLERKSITEIIPGDRVEVTKTLLLADIRSFTSISDDLDPNEIFILLNLYFSLVAPIVRRHSGFIVKYEGDGFIALFPEKSDDAIICAKEMQKTLNTIPLEIRTDKRIKIKIGISIDTGNLVLGAAGTLERMDAVVISDCTVNLELMQKISKMYEAPITITNRALDNSVDKTKYLQRPLQPINTSYEKIMALEIFDNDPDQRKQLKEKTKPILEKALSFIALKKFEEALKGFEEILEIYPNDPVALYYKIKLFEQLKK